jgi:hypothetical protein
MNTWFFIVITWYGATVGPKGTVIDAKDESSCQAMRTYYEEMMEKQVLEDDLTGFIITECEPR